MKDNFRWSKEVISKIQDANILDKRDVRTLERILRTHEFQEHLLNYQCGIENENIGELIVK